MQADLRRFADFNGLSEEEIAVRCAGLHAKVVALTLIRKAAERSYGEIMEAFSSHFMRVMRFLASCSTLDHLIVSKSRPIVSTLRSIFI